MKQHDNWLLKVSAFTEFEQRKLLKKIFKWTIEEFKLAEKHFSPFNSMHEGFAVLHEEFDELWKNVKLNANKHPNRLDLIREEAIQLAAMAIRMIYDSYSSELDETKDGKKSVKANEKVLNDRDFEEFTQTYCEKCAHPENCSGQFSDCPSLKESN